MGSHPKESHPKEYYRAKAIAAALGKNDGIPQPPKGWWDDHKQRVRDEHPDHDEKKIDQAVASIWYKIYDDKRRQAAVMAEILGRST
jgi:hypothetical protein